MAPRPPRSPHAVTARGREVVLGEAAPPARGSALRCHPEERSDDGSARWRVQKLVWSRARLARAPAPLARRSGSVREQRTRLLIDGSASTSEQIPRFARDDISALSSPRKVERRIIQLACLHDPNSVEVDMPRIRVIMLAFLAL